MALSRWNYPHPRNIKDWIQDTLGEILIFFPTICIFSSHSSGIYKIHDWFFLLRKYIKDKMVYIRFTKGFKDKQTCKKKKYNKLKGIPKRLIFINHFILSGGNLEFNMR